VGPSYVTIVQTYSIRITLLIRIHSSKALGITEGVFVISENLARLSVISQAGQVR